MREFDLWTALLGSSYCVYGLIDLDLVAAAIGLAGMIAGIIGYKWLDNPERLKRKRNPPFEWL